MDCCQSIFTNSNINMEQKEEYNVIWIDDEWDTIGKSFIQICEKRHNIHIKAFKTRREGMDALEQNLKFWDAVILDAKAYNNSSSDEVADVDGLYEAIRQIERLKLKRYIPYFVLTRQPDLMDDRMFEKSVGKFYKKDSEGQNKLLSDLKEEVSKSTRFRIKTIYHDAVEQLNDLDCEETIEDIVDILESMHYPELPFKPKLYFNPLRQALEYIFRAANKVGVIPDDFFPSDNVNLNQCFMFLKGNDADKIGIRFGSSGDRLIPRNIENMMGLIINLGNANSHSKLSEAEIRETEKRFIKEGLNSHYIIYSMALQLCEIAYWMNQYISEHPNKEENLRKCTKIAPPSSDKNEEIQELIGVIELHKGVYHIGSKVCLNPAFVQQRGWLGKKVRIVKYSENTNEKSKNMFPYFASNIRLVEEPENGSK